MLNKPPKNYCLICADSMTISASINFLQIWDSEYNRLVGYAHKFNCKPNDLIC